MYIGKQLCNPQLTRGRVTCLKFIQWPALENKTSTAVKQNFPDVISKKGTGCNDEDVWQNHNLRLKRERRREFLAESDESPYIF